MYVILLGDGFAGMVSLFAVSRFNFLMPRRDGTVARRSEEKTRPREQPNKMFQFVTSFVRVSVAFLEKSRDKFLAGEKLDFGADLSFAS